MRTRRTMKGMPKTRSRLTVLAAAFAVVLAACGSATSGGAGQQAPAATVAAATPIVGPYPSVVMPERLRGTWYANVQRPGPSNGIWRLRISEHAMQLKNPAGG